MRMQETWDSLLVSEDEPLEQDMRRRELAQQLDALLMDLPERQRIAVRLSYGLDGSPPLRQIDVRAPALHGCPHVGASCAPAYGPMGLFTSWHTVLLSGSQADSTGRSCQGIDAEGLHSKGATLYSAQSSQHSFCALLMLLS